MRKEDHAITPADKRTYGCHPQEIGQPILIGGSMGTSSYVLAGTQGAMRETFGSTCHGAGRALSRSKAKQELDSKAGQGGAGRGGAGRGGAGRGGAGRGGAGRGGAGRGGACVYGCSCWTASEALSPGQGSHDCVLLPRSELLE